MFKATGLLTSVLAFEKVEVTGKDKFVNIGVMLSNDFPEDGVISIEFPKNDNSEGMIEDWMVWGDISATPMQGDVAFESEIVGIDWWVISDWLTFRPFTNGDDWVAGRYFDITIGPVILEPWAGSMFSGQIISGLNGEVTESFKNVPLQYRLNDIHNKYGEVITSRNEDFDSSLWIQTSLGLVASTILALYI